MTDHKAYVEHQLLKCVCHNKGARTCPTHPNRAGDGANNPHNGKHCVCQKPGAQHCQMHPNRGNPANPFGTGRAGRRLAVVIERDGHHCHYCGIDLYNPDVIGTTDHKTPLALGGENALINIVPCCYVCNHSKGNLTEHEYFEALAKGNLKARIRRAQADIDLRIQRIRVGLDMDGH